MPKDTPATASVNLALWGALAPVDRRFTKPITGKSYKGDSPNPTYVIQKLTEQLGPIGVAWGFNVVRETVRLGKPQPVIVEDHKDFAPPDGNGAQAVLTHRIRREVIREEMHQVEIEFWIVDKDGTRRSFSSFGGTPMLYLSKKGEWVHDEDAAKKSLTDAYVKAASWLGACADIFLGLFDDKYSAFKAGDEDAAPPATGGQAPQADMPPAGKTPAAKRQTTAENGW